jgi:2-succinyl-5-enolpyruvyl-6-hydroxy-3-cyclohexene-1-carboxylate synthase
VNPESTAAKFEFLASLVEICAQHGLEQVIISPGSRSAPLTVAFARHPRLTCRVVLDERSAGFIALGLAQQTRRPVGLVCTSGTAALNYGPAVSEAFYQQIPLLVFTADRPPEWIDQQDGQTIRQQHLYVPHIRGSFETPVDLSHPDARRQAERLISEAIQATTWPTPGPVHLNVPLREPLYSDGPVTLPKSPTIIRHFKPEPTLTEDSWIYLRDTWQQAKRKLVIAGLQPPHPGLATTLSALQSDPSVAVIADIAANLYDQGTGLRHSDMILGSKSTETLEALKPDLVVSFGGPVISKYLKLFLRRHQPAGQWLLQPDGQAIDTYQSLTEVISVYPNYFFKNLVEHRPEFSNGAPPAPPGSYQHTWLKLEEQAQELLATFFETQPFGEFAAVRQVLRALPPDSNLHLGNSMPIRYASFIGLGWGDGPPGLTVNANRGTSGIDGSLSTTVGAALANHQITTLISGDLAFFYDRNALWHQHVPPNLRVVILNNGGGGIFKLIDGPNKLPPAELKQFFFTPQPLTAKNTAADHNCAYYHCRDAETLAQLLPGFFKPHSQPAILEIETDSDLNGKVFGQFKARVAGLAAR